MGAMSKTTFTGAAGEHYVVYRLYLPLLNNALF